MDLARWSPNRVHSRLESWSAEEVLEKMCKVADEIDRCFDESQLDGFSHSFSPTRFGAHVHKAANSLGIQEEVQGSSDSEPHYPFWGYNKHHQISLDTARKLYGHMNPVSSEEGDETGYDVSGDDQFFLESFHVFFSLNTSQRYFSKGDAPSWTRDFTFPDRVWEGVSRLYEATLRAQGMRCREEVAEDVRQLLEKKGTAHPLLFQLVGPAQQEMYMHNGRLVLIRTRDERPLFISQNVLWGMALYRREDGRAIAYSQFNKEHFEKAPKLLGLRR